jgi:hypothetical protein
MSFKCVIPLAGVLTRMPSAMRFMRYDGSDDQSAIVARSEHKHTGFTVAGRIEYIGGFGAKIGGKGLWRG